MRYFSNNLTRNNRNDVAKKIIVILIIFQLLYSCNDGEAEDKCLSTGIGYITSVNAPASGLVGETIDIELDFIVINGCGEFGKFIENQNNTILDIEIEAKYDGCICTQDIPTRKIKYQFIPESTGNYELNFKSSPTEFITVTLSIN